MTDTNHIGDLNEMLREYRQAWLEWLQTNESLAIEQWLLAYADATPRPTESEDSEAICGYIDRRMREAAAEIKRLREERDEAQVDQRLIDELWDRRTETTDMKEQIKRLREERDEARRLACRCSSSSGSASESLEEAQLRGWDCFKEDRA